MELSPGTAPIPDGQTVPHTAAVLLAAVWSRPAFRLAHLRHRLAQMAYIGCMVATALLITLGSVHPSQ